MSKKNLSKGDGNVAQIRIKNQLPQYHNKRSIYDNPFVDRYKYQQIWQQYALSQWCSQFEWKDLPFNMTSDKLMYELYNKGWLLGYKFNGQPCITPAIPCGLNMLGLPAYYDGIDFIGNKTEKGLVAGVNCVVLNSRVSTTQNNLAQPLAQIDRVIIEDIAETLARLQVNLINSSVKIVAVSGDSNANEILRQEMKKVVASDNAVAVISSQFETANLTKSFAEIKFAEYIDLAKNYEELRCQLVGQESKATAIDKKQYVSNGEMSQDNNPNKSIKGKTQELFESFVEDFNKITGATISVKAKGGESEQENNTNVDENVKDKEGRD